MRLIHSQLSPKNERFQSNYASMQKQLERLNGLLARSLQGGGEKNIERHLRSGKLLPMNRQ